MAASENSGPQGLRRLLAESTGSSQRVVSTRSGHFVRIGGSYGTTSEAPRSLVAMQPNYFTVGWRDAFPVGWRSPRSRFPKSNYGLRADRCPP